MRAIFAALLLMSAPALAESLTVKVSGAGSGGKIVASLHEVSDGFSSFDTKKAKIVKSAPPSATGSATLVFEGLAPGRYAVSAFHDEDGNNKVKTNFIGIPREAVGVSNNPGGMPSFSKSLVTVPAPKPIEIELRKIGG
jgi:uncharacterized protein (DUF2141 family)